MYEISLASPEKIFFLWLLLNEASDTSLTEKLDDKYIVLDLKGMLYGIITPSEVKFIIDELINYKIIQECYTFHKYNKKKTSSTIGETIYCTALNKPKNMLKNAIHKKTTMYPDTKESEQLFFAFLINEEKLQRYLDEYMECWSNNDLYFEEQNILKKELQVETVIKDIFAIIDKHSHKNFLLSMGQYYEVDRITTLLFLVKIGDIQINSWVYEHAEYTLGYTIGSVTFRITLLEKFFEDFRQDKGKVIFNFYDLQSKSEYEKKISFSPPYSLHYNGIAYTLKRGKLPYIILNKAFQDNLITTVSIRDIMRELKESEDRIRKALENFRRSLREKFDFPESETFFDIINEEIILKSTLFKFQRIQQKKA